MSILNVFILEEQVEGTVVHLGAHFSSVRYNIGGIEFETLMENNEFILMEEDDGDDTE